MAGKKRGYAYLFFLTRARNAPVVTVTPAAPAGKMMPAMVRIAARKSTRAMNRVICSLIPLPAKP
jgi:hypothetical protein